MQTFDTDADCSVQENKSQGQGFFYPSKLTGPPTIDQYIGSHYFHTSQSIKKTKTKLLRDGKGSSSRNVTGNKKRKIKKNFLKRPQFMKKGCDAFS